MIAAFASLSESDAGSWVVSVLAEDLSEELPARKKGRGGAREEGAELLSTATSSSDLLLAKLVRRG